MKVADNPNPTSNENPHPGHTPVRRLPPWLKKRLPSTSGAEVRELLNDLNLDTVCRSAHCPNLMECYGKQRATFLIMGPNCTRRCTFCAVTKGNQAPLDPTEPERIAKAVERLGLRHAVVTSVTRDDLPDGGAQHFADTINAIRKRTDCTIEVLTPDFQGNEDSIITVAEARPEIFNHNIETCPRLYPEVRPEADFLQSLDLLSFVKKHYPEIITKSGIMLGLGETREETIETLHSLSATGCEAVTIGQYLAPSSRHRLVAEYITPEEFEAIGAEARAMGFSSVASAPFVRSSYNAQEILEELRKASV